MRRLVPLVALLLAVPTLALAATDQSGAGPPARRPPVPASGPPPGSAPASTAALTARGRTLFVSGCSFCHGVTADGVRGRAPSLRGVGAGAADFYLETGRMPLDSPRSFPARTKPAYPPSDIRALVAYVGSLGGAPIPSVDPGRGDLAVGVRAFTDHCAGCHQVGARGGIVTGAIAPALQDSSATQIAEAIRTGPYVMPSFSTREIDQHTLDSIVRYVISTRHPPDRGGWGIGHIGPIPEGMVAWLLALAGLLIVTRLIGEGSEPRPPGPGRPPPEGEAR